MPGHMQAALTAYPELGCTGGPYEVWKIWGISDDVLCAGNDDKLKFRLMCWVKSLRFSHLNIFM